jgi:hypothetical protein
MGVMFGSAGAPGMRRERFGSPAPENPTDTSADGMVPGAAGPDDQGVWPAGGLSVELSGGWPGARLGGNPVFKLAEGMLMPCISPIAGACGAGGQAGAAVGAG